jgi:alginate O-acetyltransferase complex protein AlgI
MLFNSIDFAIFLPIVFLLYWIIPKKHLRIQNGLVVIASYVFYGWWDFRFLTLIFFSTVIDYFVGRGLMRQEKTGRRKLLLLISVFVNLGFLGFFKYYNFFLENFVEAFSFFGREIQSNSLNIILPVGISFYTFQTMSYTIDVYRKQMKPTKDFIAFSAFVSFFPQLVAGPIERASNLLPQFFTSRKFDYSQAADGLRQILWGLFKKIVVADNCAEFANQIFNNSDGYGGSTLILGAILFAFQIYGDFSGYSDIAIGTARLFGFRLMRNFAFPYFSRDIAEFWRRWHISLSSWFRDYVYIPLGGSRVNNFTKIRNTFIIFIVSGFWHGANWTFIVWGALNALYFLPLLLFQANRKNIGNVAAGRALPSIREFLSMFVTFTLTCVAWIFFRAESITHALSILGEILSSSIFVFPEIIPIKVILIISVFLIIEWIGREGEYAISSIQFHLGKPWRYAFYYILIISIFWFGGNQQQFIYFQF